MRKLPKKAANMKNGLYVNIQTLKLFDVSNSKLSKTIGIRSETILTYFPYEAFQPVLDNAVNMRYVGPIE